MYLRAKITHCILRRNVTDHFSVGNYLNRYCSCICELPKTQSVLREICKCLENSKRDATRAVDSQLNQYPQTHVAMELMVFDSRKKISLQHFQYVNLWTTRTKKLMFSIKLFKRFLPHSRKKQRRQFTKNNFSRL